MHNSSGFAGFPPLFRRRTVIPSNRQNKSCILCSYLMEHGWNLLSYPQINDHPAWRHGQAAGNTAISGLWFAVMTSSGPKKEARTQLRMNPHLWAAGVGFAWAIGYGYFKFNTLQRNPLHGRWQTRTTSLKRCKKNWRQVIVLQTTINISKNHRRGIYNKFCSLRKPTDPFHNWGRSSEKRNTAARKGHGFPIRSAQLHPRDDENSYGYTMKARDSPGKWNIH